MERIGGRISTKRDQIGELKDAKEAAKEAGDMAAFRKANRQIGNKRESIAELRGERSDLRSFKQGVRESYHDMRQFSRWMDKHSFFGPWFTRNFPTTNFDDFVCAPFIGCNCALLTTATTEAALAGFNAHLCIVRKVEFMQ